MSRLLFLSHSGIDTDAAAALKARLLTAPAAREHGLSVWFDKDDLRAGEPWQSQLEEAIGKSQAFAVYVGSKGVVNWVEAEVRLALNRAITEAGYRFVPILAGAAPAPEALPGFARQFQGVFDVEARPEQFERLMQAVLGGDEAGQLQLETEPFFGLRAIDESRSHLFFGRERETEALVGLVHRTPLVLVTGDSGSGKSSLVRAGLVPRFRGGTLALLDGTRPEDTNWHVVTTRPRRQPYHQLGDAVDEAAKGLGLSLADRGTLAEWAASGEIDNVRRGLRCDLPPERLQVLLVVDQFEELLTITPPELRASFIGLLLELSDPADGRHRVVLTMRHDYANLCNAYERLKARLDADDRRARFLLGRMSNEALRRIVTEPLRLAAIEAPDREALASEVLRDVGERPGDLALVQMALTETWRARGQHGGDLLRAYAYVGRVEGSLAQAAERVRTEVLDAGQRELLDSILLRLVRLGDTGGATRRVASRGEFDDARWSLVQKLASEEGKRLVLLGGSDESPTAEIAHEALVTAWPYFQNLLQETADDKRILDTLIPRAKEWAAQKDQDERDRRRAIGTDLDRFSGLLDRRPTWLSDDEQGFIKASLRHERELVEKEQQRRREELERAQQLVESERLRAQEQEQKSRRNRRWAIALGLLALVAVSAGVFAIDRMIAAQTATQEAEAARKLAVSRQLAIASRAANDERQDTALLLADLALRTADTVEARSSLLHAILYRPRFLGFLRTREPSGRDEVLDVSFSLDGNKVSAKTWNGHLLLWDMGTRVLTSERPFPGGGQLAVSPTGRLVARSLQTAVELLDPVTGAEVDRLEHTLGEGALAFSADGSALALGTDDGGLQVWDIALRRSIGPPLRMPNKTRNVQFPVLVLKLSSDGSVLATMDTDDFELKLWDLAQRRNGSAPEPVVLRHSSGDVVGNVADVAFHPDGKTLIAEIRNNTLRRFAVESGQPIGEAFGEMTSPNGLAYHPSGDWLATGSTDGELALWDLRYQSPEIRHLIGHRGEVTGLAFSPDGNILISGSKDGSVMIWDTTDLAAWDLPRGIGNLLYSPDFVGSLAFSPDGALIAGATDSKIAFWDGSQSEPIAQIVHDEVALTSLAYSPDGKILATGGLAREGTGLVGGETVVFWDAAERSPLGDPARPSVSTGKWLTCLTFSPDGQSLVAGTPDGGLHIWDVESRKQRGEPLREPSSNSSEINQLFFTPDGRFLAVGGHSIETLWDLAERAPAHPPLQNSGSRAVALSPDGHTLAASSIDAIVLWDIDTRQRVGEFEISSVGFSYPDDRTASMAFDREGRVLASRQENGRIQLWDVASRQPMGPPLWLGSEGKLLGMLTDANLTFRPDGKVLAVGGLEGVTLWDVDPESWARLARQMANRSLTESELQLYLGAR